MAISFQLMFLWTCISAWVFVTSGGWKKALVLLRWKAKRSSLKTVKTHRVCVWLRAGENWAQVEPPVQENTPLSNQNLAQSMCFTVQGTAAVLLSFNPHSWTTSVQTGNKSNKSDLPWLVLLFTEGGKWQGKQVVRNHTVTTDTTDSFDTCTGIWFRKDNYRELGNMDKVRRHCTASGWAK